MHRVFHFSRQIFPFLGPLRPQKDLNLFLNSLWQPPEKDLSIDVTFMGMGITGNAPIGAQTDRQILPFYICLLYTSDAADD